MYPFTLIYLFNKNIVYFLYDKISFYHSSSSLQWLRGPHKNVEIELDTIRSNVRTSRINLLNRMSTLASTTSVPNGGTTSQQLPTHLQDPQQQHQNGNRVSARLSQIVRSCQLPRVSFDTVVSNVKAVMRNARLVKPVSITCGLMIFQRFTGRE